MTETRESMPRGASVRFVVTLSLVTSLFAFGCVDGDDLEEQAARVMRRTIPPGVSEPHTVAERGKHSFSARWSFKTDMDAAGYRAWVSESVGSLFVSRRGDDNSLVFSKQLEGDLHTLRLTLTVVDSRLNADAVFTAMPW